MISLAVCVYYSQLKSFNCNSGHSTHEHTQRISSLPAEPLYLCEPAAFTILCFAVGFQIGI